MFSVSMIGALLLLALVLFEMQVLSKAVMYAASWPSHLKPLYTPTMQRLEKANGVSVLERAALAVSRYAYSSLVFHQVHGMLTGASVHFKVIPSLFFGLTVFAGAFVADLPLGVAASVAFQAGCTLFLSSQMRKFAMFSLERSVAEANFSKKLSSMASG